MKYRANRGGHAPGHLREAFIEAVEAADTVGGGEWYSALAEDEHLDFWNPKMRARWEAWGARERGLWLLGQLWNCTDIMPSGLCDTLDLTAGSTYAKAARTLRHALSEAA